MAKTSDFNKLDSNQFGPNRLDSNRLGPDQLGSDYS